MKSILRILTIALFAMVMVGCASAEPTQAPKNLVTPQATAYPGTGLSPEGAYPGYPAPTPPPSLESTSYPEPIVVQNIATPTTAAGTGKVTGKMLLKGVIVKNVALGLGAVLKSKEGAELVTSFGRPQSPTADTRDDGTFTFVNVPPGRYGLIFADLPETYLLIYPGKKDAILMTVEAEKTLDLGVLDFADLPK